MSRSGYSDDYENINLYRAAVDRAISGKRGQAFLRELAEALDAMPVKRLITDALEHEGEVCALGSVGLKRGIDMKALDPHEPDQIGLVFNIAPSLAAEVEFENDERYESQTPERRWERMRKWAADNLRPFNPEKPISGSSAQELLGKKGGE